ncbi:MAG: tyrosine recombinase XerC [Chloroflexota bacterium]|nr:tyrosine recombinase XerC [Chloroflexota bacterium]
MIPFLQSEESVAELIDNYTRYLEAERHASRYTVRNYIHDLRHFIDFLVNNNIPTLEDTDVHLLRRYIASLLEEGFERSSVARKLSALRSFYTYLTQENLVSVNPLLNISSPKLIKRLPSFLSNDEVKKLIEAPDSSTPQGMRDRAMLELLYASGLRVSEVASLDILNVNLDSREVSVWGKGSKERLVLIGKPAARAIDSYLKEGRPHLVGKRSTDALFLNRYGKRLSKRSVQKTLSRYAIAAGLDKRVFPHMIRHSFATHLLDGGADLRVVQELLGHTNLSTTQIYTHVTQAQARKVYLATHPRAKKRGD